VAVSVVTNARKNNGISRCQPAVFMRFVARKWPDQRMNTGTFSFELHVMIETDAIVRFASE
jgi:hypothetical protein